MARISAAIFVLVVYVFSQSAALAQSTGLFSTGSGASATEDTAVELPAELNAETVRDLVSRLSDTQVRELLLQRLDAVAQQQSVTESGESATTGSLISSWSTGIYRSFSQATVRIPLIGSSLWQAFTTFIERRGLQGNLRLFGGLAAGIAAGLFAYRLVINSRLSRFVRSPDADATLWQNLKILAVRFGIDLLSLLVFFVVALVVHHFVLTPQDGPITRQFMQSIVVVPLAVLALSRFILSPNWPQMRLVHTDDWTAKYLHRNQYGLALLAGFSVFIVRFSSENGVTMGTTRLGFWLNLAIFVWLAVIFYRARHGFTKMILGGDGDATPFEARVARAFPVFAIIVIVLVWLMVEIIASQGRFDLLVAGQQYFTLAVIGLAPALDTMVRGLVRHLVPPMIGEGEVAERAYRSTKQSYVRIGRVALFAVIIMLMARLWGIDLNNLATAGLGAQLAGHLVEFLIVIAVGYLVWELTTLWLNRKLAAEQTSLGFDLAADEPGGGEGGGTGGSRLSTVLPMLRLAIQTAIITVTLLIALGSLGINITPLLAGAGVVGIAIGFGAQTLVRDVVSGIFFLIDDAFRVGEYLVIGDTVGTVEKISVRSLILRHHTGPIHTIPYGEIPKVTNNSRDWVIMKLKFTFPFETDVNQIKRIFKKVGQDMLEQSYAGDLLQTFKSQGVYAVDDVGIVIRGKYMTKPGGQWIIRKDIYQRVQKALEEAGIQFARKEVRVQLPSQTDVNNLSADEKRAIAAAASDAAEKEQPVGEAKPA